MKIIFKNFKDSNFKDLEKCMLGLQDFLITIDPLKRLRRLNKFGESYTKNLIKTVVKDNGVIILAYDKDKIIGCIAGVIENQAKNNLLECIPTKSGRILELFVSDEYRGIKLGKKLMQKMEEYFKKKKCTIIRVEVFVPNKGAHNFYQKLNYSDRIVDMVKPLR